MAKDAELDRLKTAQDLAYQRKQSAYGTQQQAWERRSSARDAMNRAFEAKQRAHRDQESSWEDYQRIRSDNGPRIDQLNSLQETAYQNMLAAFNNASSAHDRRDGAAARSYADDGHGYKAESQRHVADRRQLVQQIRSARDRHDPYKAAFHRAKEDFSSAKRTFDQAKAEHERAQAKFNSAKAEFEQAKKAFQTRLTQLKSESSKRQQDKRSVAERAGVPYRYRDNVWISNDPNGNTNIYFGGIGEPNGPGHGHYVLDSSNNVTYKRDPYDPHGSQNFTDSSEKGSSLYDRRARSESEPLGGEGVFARRDGGREHTTQYYDDGYRLSSDTDGKSNSKRHWTNQNVGKKSPKRHTPPNDAH